LINQDFEATGYSISKTKQHPLWKATTGKDSKKKELITKQDPLWKATIGSDAKRKERETKMSHEWKEKNSTVCPDCSKKLSKAMFTRWHKDGKCKSKMKETM
jgi:hypothetical protein